MYKKKQKKERYRKEIGETNGRKIDEKANIQTWKM